MINSRWTAANPLEVTIRPQVDPRANAVTSRSISLASRRSSGLNSTPNEGATDWIEANWPIPAGIVASRRTAARVTSRRDLFEQLQPFAADAVFGRGKPGGI